MGRTAALPAAKEVHPLRPCFEPPNRRFDCRDELPDRESLLDRIRTLVLEMYEGLDELVRSCQFHGIAKNWITSHRLVAHRTAVGLDLDGRLKPYLGA